MTTRISTTNEPVYLTSVYVSGIAPMYRIYTGPHKILSHWLSLDTLNIWMPFGIQYELIKDNGKLIIGFEKPNN
jgi:hypothetical protein